MQQKFLIGILLVATMLLGNVVAAQELDYVVCAAIYPCDPDGQVQPPYNQAGPCQSYYQAMCSAGGDKPVDDLNYCISETVTLSQHNSALTETNTKLRRRLRQMRRRAALAGN